MRHFIYWFCIKVYINEKLDQVFVKTKKHTDIKDKEKLIIFYIWYLKYGTTINFNILFTVCSLVHWLSKWDKISLIESNFKALFFFPIFDGNEFILINDNWMFNIIILWVLIFLLKQIYNMGMTSFDYNKVTCGHTESHLNSHSTKQFVPLIM